MDLKKIFRRTILFYYLYFIIYIGYMSFAILVLETDVDTVPWNTYNTVSAFIILIYLINLFLLYMIKPLGKKIFLPLYVLILIMELINPNPDYSYINNITYFIESLEYTIVGIIIAMLYFSDLKKDFEN